MCAWPNKHQSKLGFDSATLFLFDKIINYGTGVNQFVKRLKLSAMVMRCLDLQDPVSSDGHPTTKPGE